MIFILKGSPMIGIYSIKNVKNNNCYFGSSKNIEKRWKTHLNQLKNNKHHNIRLQRAWNKYGENNFIFEIVEECDETNLLQLEQKYIDLNPKYNISLFISIFTLGNLEYFFSLFSSLSFTDLLLSIYSNIINSGFKFFIF
jgi:group I intron endonuclease